jgi:hypothetical protein
VALLGLEHVVGHIKQADIADCQSRLFTDFANCARFERFTELHVAARRGPRAFAVDVLPLEQEQFIAARDEHTDADGRTWEPDQVFTPGDWGYTNHRGPARSTRREIAGTDEQPLYRTLRQNPVEFRFEGLPAGTYEVNLRFATITNTQPGRQLFDVIVQEVTVLPAYDIAQAVGNFTADDHTFTATVGDDGRLRVRFVNRQGPHPFVNALSVVQQPGE